VKAGNGNKKGFNGMTEDERRTVDRACQIVLSKKKKKHDKDLYQQLWLEVLERRLLERHKPKKSNLETYLVFCMMRAYLRHTYRKQNVFERGMLTTGNPSTAFCEDIQVNSWDRLAWVETVDIIDKYGNMETERYKLENISGTSLHGERRVMNISSA